MSVALWVFTRRLPWKLAGEIIIMSIVLQKGNQDPKAHAGWKWGSNPLWLQLAWSSFHALAASQRHPKELGR